MKKILIVIGIILILAGGYWLITRSANESSPVFTDLTDKDSVIVKISKSTYDPQYIRIKAGTTVNWINDDSLSHLIASDPHPGHTDLPGLESPDLAPGASYNFKFDQLGTFGYHCHLHPSITGRIIVE